MQIWNLFAMKWLDTKGKNQYQGPCSGGNLGNNTNPDYLNQFNQYPFS